MSDWLLDLAKEACPQRPWATGPLLATSMAERWTLVANLAGVTTDQLALLVANKFGLPRADIKPVNPQLARVLPARTARRYHLLPIDMDERTLTVACADPGNDEAKQAAAFASGRRVNLQVATPEEIDTGITLLYAQETAQASHPLLSLLDLDENGVDIALGDTAPVARLCRALIKQAIERRASDLHIHPFVGGGVVRLRVDGVLQRVATVPADVLEAMLRFFKSQSKMDPTLSRTPQDGRCHVTFERRQYDMRMSTLPAVGGESLVIRLLDRTRVHELKDSRFSNGARMSLQRMVGSANGLILLTGPTGSGKTSTLYALLASLNHASQRIITVEEPVEYQMAGITQVDVHARSGMSFSSALRAILRQDPDTLLIGEIRDEETADIALNAALTGHLVLSTLHTMDALRAIPRLLELGVEPTVLADTLVGVVSQRLVRALCVACRQPVGDRPTPMAALFQEVVDEPVKYQAVGCKQCHYTGYLGRVPLVEILEMDDAMRRSLMSGATDHAALLQALPSGWTNIHANAVSRIISGETTPEEVHAALGTGFWNAMSAAYHKPVPLQAVLLAQRGQEDAARVSVLVVSMDEAMGASLVKALDQARYPARWARTASDARLLLEARDEIEILVVDTDSGAASMSLLLELRRELAWSGLPVILLVDPNDSDFTRMLSEHGANHCLSRPVDVAALISHVEGLLR